MGKINDRVGANLRRIRLSRGMTADDLSAAVMSGSGVEISPFAILRYERGDARLTVEDKILLAHALDCNPYALEDGADRPEESPAPVIEVKKLTAEEHAIFYDIATRWRGNRRALILAMACYAALPEAYALRAILSLMAEVTRALAAKAILHSDLPAGLPYLEDCIGDLCAQVGEETV